MTTIGFRRGDLVEVRTPTEILATLDERGMFENVPFMPEMAQYCGRRFTVERRTEKICNTVVYNQGSLRLRATVLLGDLRCDGSGHSGCQAECRIYWKEAWLRGVTPDTPAADPPDSDAMALLMERSSQNLTSRAQINGKVQEIWRCQSTELERCTEPLKTFDPRPYVREYTCGNVGLGHFLRISATAAVVESGRKLNLISGFPLAGSGESPPPESPLNLQPGDYVQIKSKEEIAKTLTPESTNRGLWFDEEMKAYCGGTYRVRRRVTRFIDERSGRMVEMKSDAVTLDDVVCTGDRSLHRWFCPRAIYPYWRECWLKRVEPEVASPLSSRPE